MVFAVKYLQLTYTSTQLTCPADRCRSAGVKHANAYEKASTSTIAWTKACGASCGMLWPTPPVMSR